MLNQDEFADKVEIAAAQLKYFSSDFEDIVARLGQADLADFLSNRQWYSDAQDTIESDIEQLGIVRDFFDELNSEW